MANLLKENEKKEEFVDRVYNDPQLSIPIKIKQTNKKNEFGHYLTGLIEGDGYISITNKNRVILGITFNIKDKPLAELILKKIGGGFIVKRKTNSIELRFGSIKTIKKIIGLINGKFRTPKIDQFNILVDWMNKNNSLNLTKLPLDDTPIDKNSWLAGFIDADGSFYIKNNPKQIQCKFSLEQRMIYPKTKESYKLIMEKICKNFNVILGIRTRKNLKNSYYIIKIENQKAVNLLIQYLGTYTLFTKKYLDYIEWVKAQKLIIEKKHLTDEGKSRIKTYKKNMNNSRTDFNWEHLNNIL